jgi:hypothetical protein
MTRCHRRRCRVRDSLRNNFSDLVLCIPPPNGGSLNLGNEGQPLPVFRRLRFPELEQRLNHRRGRSGYPRKLEVLLSRGSNLRYLLSLFLLADRQLLAQSVVSAGRDVGCGLAPDMSVREGADRLCPIGQTEHVRSGKCVHTED